MPRMLHTMLRVGDMKRSVDFYTRVMGMKLLRETDTRISSIPSPSSATTARTKPR